MTSYLVRLDGNILVDTYEARQLNVIPREVKMNQCDPGIFKSAMELMLV